MYINKKKFNGISIFKFKKIECNSFSDGKNDNNIIIIVLLLYGLYIRRVKNYEPSSINRNRDI